MKDAIRRNSLGLDAQVHDNNYRRICAGYVQNFKTDLEVSLCLLQSIYISTKKLLPPLPKKKKISTNLLLIHGCGFRNNSVSCELKNLP